MIEVRACLRLEFILNQDLSELIDRYGEEKIIAEIKNLSGAKYVKAFMALLSIIKEKPLNN
jgi:hypothetical protein